MSGLHLDHFLRADDYESAQYRILGRLQEVRSAFSNNEIYPHLSGLISLYGTLNDFLQRAQDFQDRLPKEIKGIDLAQQRMIYERRQVDLGQMSYLQDLIEWALPHVQAAIEEGRAIFEFVEEHLHLEEVGVMPSYVEEGYLLVPDRASSLLHVLQYTLSIFTKADERYRSLKTVYVKSIRQGTVHAPPQRIKLDLLAEHRELPNPATYFFDTELDFPFEQTMLPVAKRKLMQYLSGQA